ncbi:hypothetical protein AMELA_G00063300 [Ameiurus melas]|uniref:Uncharacterized protein n=1 Tax=Ameiurus melas TaxID=219545 RepID=A0A7J6B2B2_AMEME|nr:hypothetical protein AMELA_G00063300 [Ameiurus melas]
MVLFMLGSKDNYVSACVEHHLLFSTSCPKLACNTTKMADLEWKTCGRAHWSKWSRGTWSLSEGASVTRRVKGFHGCKKFKNNCFRVFLCSPQHCTSSNCPSHV